MATFPFLLVLEAVLVAGGTGTVSYPIPSGETLELDELVFQSTGVFNVSDIRDSNGNHFTNASLTTEIPSVVLASGANNNNALKRFPIPIEIKGSTIFYVDLEDSSGAGNTVTLVFAGRRTTP
jgi:hypothetical protein